MIRLGSLAGYPFEGPRVLAGWTVPAVPAVYAVMYQPDEDAEAYAVIYVGHTEDLRQERLPFRHSQSACWVKRAGSKWRLHVAWFEVPGGQTGHRKQIAEELCAVYSPGCNEQQFDRTWKDEWIGGYTAPTIFGRMRNRRSRRSTLSVVVENKAPTTGRLPSSGMPLLDLVFCSIL